jgi:hypothetical protein
MTLPNPLFTIKGIKNTLVQFLSSNLKKLFSGLYLFALLEAGSFFASKIESDSPARRPGVNALFITDALDK